MLRNKSAAAATVLLCACLAGQAWGANDRNATPIELRYFYTQSLLTFTADPRGSHDVILYGVTAEVYAPCFAHGDNFTAGLSTDLAFGSTGNWAFISTDPGTGADTRWDVKTVMAGLYLLAKYQIRWDMFDCVFVLGNGLGGGFFSQSSEYNWREYLWVFDPATGLYYDHGGTGAGREQALRVEPVFDLSLGVYPKELGIPLGLLVGVTAGPVGFVDAPHPFSFQGGLGLQF